MRPVYSSPIPAGWSESSLKLLTTRRRGYSWTKSQETSSPDRDTVPVVRIPNIQDQLDLRELLYLRGVEADDLAASGVDQDWILFVASNGNPDRIGDSVLIDTDRPMLFASFLQGITARTLSTLLPAFLAEWMRLDTVHQTFSKTSQQTTGLANFSWGAVKNLPLRYPTDLGEQQAIVDRLAVADAARFRVEALVTAVDRVRTALIQQLVTRGMPGVHNDFQDSRIGPVPRSWTPERMTRLFDRIEAGSSPQCESHPARPGYWGVLKVSAVSWDGFDESENKELPASLEPDLDAELRVGDLLVSRANTTGLCGAAQIVGNVESQLLLCDKTWRVVPKDDIDARWLLLVLRSQATRRQIEAVATGTSDSMKNISQRDFGRMSVAVPPEHERRAAVDAMAAWDRYRDSLLSQRRYLAAVRRSLHEDLLRGRVRLVDPVAA